jgi:hypothetical protein
MPRQNALLTAALTALLIFAHADASLARPKKADTTDVMGLPRDADGTPIIMKGYRSERVNRNRPDTAREDTSQPKKQASKPVRIPRGSSTYIPPPVPSPTASRAVTTGQAVQPYNPPPITTYSDRVNSAIRSYPLNKGLGNNPTDMQMYIRQNSMP